MKGISFDDFEIVVKKNGPQIGFGLVINDYYTPIENRAYNMLNKYRGLCIDPKSHKEDITQITFSKFWGITNKISTGEYKRKIESLDGYLKGICNKCILDHLPRCRCLNLPPNSTVWLDDVEYLLIDNNSENVEEALDHKEAILSLPVEFRDFLAVCDIEKVLAFKEAIQSLPIEYYNALADALVYKLSHEQIAQKRNITVAISKRLRHVAKHKCIRYVANKYYEI